MVSLPIYDGPERTIYIKNYESSFNITLEHSSSGLKYAETLVTTEFNDKITQNKVSDKLKESIQELLEKHGEELHEIYLSKTKRLEVGS